MLTNPPAHVHHLPNHDHLFSILNVASSISSIKDWRLLWLAFRELTTQTVFCSPLFAPVSLSCKRNMNLIINPNSLNSPNIFPAKALPLIANDCKSKSRFIHSFLIVWPIHVLVFAKSYVIKMVSLLKYCT